VCGDTAGPEEDCAEGGEDSEGDGHEVAVGGLVVLGCLAGWRGERESAYNTVSIQIGVPSCAAYLRTA
jgi:hypothetical protein